MKIVGDEPKLIKRLVEVLALMRPGLRVLDCACGNAFPVLYIVKMGVKLTRCDGSPLVVEALAPFAVRRRGLERTLAARARTRSATSV